MRGRKIAWLAGGVTGAMALALALLLFTPPGLALVGRMVSPLTGGMVRITTLHGYAPGHVTAARVDVADAQGVWLRVENVSLRWSPLSLLFNRVSVRAVAAAQVMVLRRPVPSDEDSGSGPRITVDRLDLPRITLGKPVIGQDVRLSASGSLRYASLRDFSADLVVTRANSADRYRIAGAIVDDAAQGVLTIREGADGVLGRLLDLPGLGPVNLTARADGPKSANRLVLDLTAGTLTAKGGGVLRLAAQAGDLDLQLASGAMALRDDLGWDSLSGAVQLRGRFRAPQVTAKLDLHGGHFGDASAQLVALRLDGDLGKARLTGTLDGLRLPGAHPDIFAASPMTLHADADLHAATRPVQLQLEHRLMTLQGQAQTRGGLQLDAKLDIPSLTPLAALEDVAMDGRATLHVTLRQSGTRMALAADGRLDARGASLPARLLGQKASLMLTAQADGADITASRMQMQGAALEADVSGTLKKGELDYRLSLDMTDVSRLTPILSGKVALDGDVRGAIGEATLAARGNASLATRGFARQRLAIALEAQGLPAARSGKLTVQGRFDDAPLSLRATLQGDKTRQMTLAAQWRSLAANGQLALATALTGTVTASVQQLSDLSVFTGMPLSGRAEARATFTAKGARTQADLQLALQDVKQDALAARSVTLQGQVGDMLGKPVLDMTLAARGLKAQGFAGDADAELKGPTSALALNATAKLADDTGAPALAEIAALANLPAGDVTLSRLSGTWRNVTATLQEPATLHYAKGIFVENLALRVGQGTLRASGRLSPQLAFQASATNLALADFRALFPRAGLRGTLSGDANLSGTLAAPLGRVTLRGDGLRTDFASRALPAAMLRADATLQGDRAQLDASLQAGETVRLALKGTAPVTQAGAMSLHAGGTADLALLDPILAADGRRARGTLAFETDITGTLAAPRVNGSGTLAAGEFQDYMRGLRISDIAASLRADGGRIVMTQMTGRAGDGTLAASGSLDLDTPGLPISLSLEARQAKPIISDLFTATLDGNLKLDGTLRQQMTLSGRVRVSNGEINLPDHFPPEVAVLKLRRKGAPPPPPPRMAQSRIMLDVMMQTSGPLFVRGQGIEAEMGGGIRLGGTTTLPNVSGGFRLVRGNYALAGQRLDFTSGTVRFDGAGLRARLDPTLDFTAQTVSGGVTATLNVTGYASAPRILLSSTPPLPQDEVVAHLLFQQSVKELTPLQLASIAQAAATLGGVGGGLNPLGRVRRTLGLDRLSVGSTNNATGESQTTVEAGRYVSRNVYVGVRQTLSGGTQTTVQVDITRRLKAQATIAAGTDATTTRSTAQQDNGSSIGLSYQLEY